MILVKILKRKDASSLIVAIILGTIIWQMLHSASSDLAATISGIKDSESFYGDGYAMPAAGWEQTYLYPVVWGLIQIVLLEILAWIVILLGSAAKQSAKK